MLTAYAGWLPAPVIVPALVVPGILFAASALGARFVAHRLSPLAGAFAFAASWTSWDYLASFGPDGTAMSPSYSQVGAPVLVQCASVFALWPITFLLGLVPGGIAMTFTRRRWIPSTVALPLLAWNATFGLVRIASAGPTESVRVGLAVEDAPIGAGVRADARSALEVVDAYAAAARALTSQGVSLIVLPEKVAVLEAHWRGEAVSWLQAARGTTRATIVIGFNDRKETRLNDALIFPSDGSAPGLYAKRHPVSGVEHSFLPGHSSFALPDHTGVAICKGMDCPATLRQDAAAVPTLMAVPVWDFGADGWWHARLAIMGGVEEGFAVARAAKEGLLTLSDAYGRVLRIKPTDAGVMVTLTGDLPGGPGNTVYRRIGDVSARAAIGLGVVLTAAASVKRRVDK